MNSIDFEAAASKGGAEVSIAVHEIAGSDSAHTQATGGKNIPIEIDCVFETTEWATLKAALITWMGTTELVHFSDTVLGIVSEDVLVRGYSEIELAPGIYKVRIMLTRAPV